MQKLNLVKAIVRYTPTNIRREFVHGRLKNDDPSRYLLLQKAEDKFFPENIGKWEFVGGMIKDGETSREAIMREMKEETGLEYRIVKQFPTITKTDEKYNIRCDVYLVNSASMNINISSEHSDYRWVKIEDVKKQDLVRYANLILEFFNNPKEHLV